MSRRCGTRPRTGFQGCWPPARSAERRASFRAASVNVRHDLSPLASAAVAKRHSQEPLRGGIVQGLQGLRLPRQYRRSGCAFVIATAFAKVVDTFVSAIVTPVINAFPGASVNGWGSRFAAVHSRPRPSSRLNADQLADRLRAYGRDHLLPLNCAEPEDADAPGRAAGTADRGGPPNRDPRLVERSAGWPQHALMRPASVAPIIRGAVGARGRTNRGRADQAPVPPNPPRVRRPVDRAAAAVPHRWDVCCV